MTDQKENTEDKTPSEQDFSSKWRDCDGDCLRAIVHEGRDNLRALVFIHGLTGDERATWTYVSEEKKTTRINKNRKAANATTAFFPDLVFGDPDLSDYDVYTFRYRSTYVDGPSIENVAKKLKTEFDRRLRNYEQVVILAHSLGGLISMQYVIDEVMAGNEIRISGILLYGVPTRGSHLASLARNAGLPLKFAAVGTGYAVAGSVGATVGRVLAGVFSKWITSHTQVEQLELGGQFVQRLNDEWSYRIVNGGHPTVDADKRGTIPVRAIIGEFDRVVPKDSAISYYAKTDSHEVYANHVGLVKPESRSDLRYDHAKDFLKQCRSRLDLRSLIALRSVSDRVLTAANSPVCKDWNYHVELHLKPTTKCVLGQAGFTKHVVKNNEFIFRLDEELVLGCAWDGTTVEGAWGRKEKPFWLHGIRWGNKANAAKYVAALDSVKNKPDEESWQTLFPEFDLGVEVDNSTIPLVPGRIEKQHGNMLLRRYTIPRELSHLINRNVRYRFNFRSFQPENMSSYTLVFPDFHAGFDGTIAIHGAVDSIQAKQFLQGEDKLEEEAGVSNSYKTVFYLRTNSIVLPGSKIRIEWKPS